MSVLPLQNTPTLCRVSKLNILPLLKNTTGFWERWPLTLHHNFATVHLLMLSELGNSLHRSSIKQEAFAQKPSDSKISFWKHKTKIIWDLSHTPKILAHWSEQVSCHERTHLAKADTSAQITLHNKILQYQHETPENTLTSVLLQMQNLYWENKTIAILILLDWTNLISLLVPYYCSVPSIKTRIYSTIWWDETEQITKDLTIWFVRFIFSRINSLLIYTKLSLVLSQEEGTWSSMAGSRWSA